MRNQTTKISIVIPVYNEADIIEQTIEGLSKGIAQYSYTDHYEILLCENGSTDQTAQIARTLAIKYPQLRIEQLPVASYGKSIKHGILNALGEKIVIFNADFWDLHFLDQAITLLDQYDLVIGSKNVPGAIDQRPWFRRLITRSFNIFLRLSFGFQGTETHGIKAFRFKCGQQIIRECITDGEVIDTEFVIRAQREGFKSIEIPVDVRETRPTRYSLLQRVPRTIRDMCILWKVFHMNK